MRRISLFSKFESKYSVRLLMPACIHSSHVPVHWDRFQILIGKPAEKTHIASPTIGVGIVGRTLLKQLHVLLLAQVSIATKTDCPKYMQCGFLVCLDIDVFVEPDIEAGAFRTFSKDNLH